jgi:hypothetical protein
MYDALGTLSQSINVSKKMLLKNKLTSMRMRKIDKVSSYFMKMVALKDDIVANRDTYEDNEIF